MTTTTAVLRFLADLAPTGAAHDESLTWDVRTNGPVVMAGLRWQWVGAAAPADVPRSPARTNGRLMDLDGELTAPGYVAAPTIVGDRDRWTKTVTLHGEQGVGRLARLSLVGSGVVAGRRRTVLAPLYTGEVDTRRRGTGEQGPSAIAEALGLEGSWLAAAASSTPPPGIAGDELMNAMHRLRTVRDRLRDAGVAVEGVVVDGIANALTSDRLWLCLGDVRYVEVTDGETPRVEALRAWAAEPPEVLAQTALGAVYAVDDAVGVTDAADGPGAAVHSPLPLTTAQRDAVRLADTADVSVVSGAPGTGKSHTAVAIALDQVARGRSVLLATRSGHAADVLTDLLDRQPGPAPVRFGGGTSRRALADRLAEGMPPAATRAERQAVEAAEEAAGEAVRDARDVLAALLSVVGGGPDPGTEALLRTDVPGAFAPAASAHVLAGWLADARDTSSWIARLRGAWSERRLRSTLGVAPDVPLPRIEAAMSLARRRRLASELGDTGGVDVAGARQRLADADESLREAVGRRVDVTERGAPDRGARRAVAGLAAALRAGPARRAALLAQLDAGDLTAAMPLWVGTVGEVERLLPRVPAMFDLVVLDEASQLDQLVAAPVLARAARAVVVGDPRQLRHVSFVADLDVETSLRRHALDDLAPVLDVRRVSTFDAAAAAAPVRWLDEHLRSRPHLIAFSAERFYDEHLHLATVHPSTAAMDVIDTLHVDGVLDGGVVAAEIRCVLEEVARLAACDDPGTVGVVTPFRDQADALEEALLDAVDVDTMTRLSLRVGTVHAFQGSERDRIVVSLGVTEDGPPQRRSFASDPHLLNVMVTRARERMLVITSLPVGTGGLIGDYLEHAEQPPSPPVGRAPSDPWTVALMTECRRNGLRVRPGPRVGRAGIDLVIGDDDDPVAVLTRPHPDGLDADVERYETLRRAGWRVREEYATPTDDDAVHRALALRAAAG